RASFHCSTTLSSASRTAPRAGRVQAGNATRAPAAPASSTNRRRDIVAARGTDPPTPPPPVALTRGLHCGSGVSSSPCRGDPPPDDRAPPLVLMRRAASPPRPVASRRARAGAGPVALGGTASAVGGACGG